MTSRSNRTYITLFVAFAVPAALGLWVLTAPAGIAVSTYAALTALLVAVAAVTLMSARNAGPTGSLGQLLYETEHPVVRQAKRDARRNGSW